MLHDFRKIRLKIGKEDYTLYVAETNAERKQGLSGIKNMPKNTGMIFCYENEKHRTFTFRETLIPLTIYFIDSKGKVVQKSFSYPHQYDSITCKKPCMWVIEIPR